jgi:maleate cis-trans isomerase
MQQVRLGVLVPAGNRETEPDMYKMAPEGVTVHFERIGAQRSKSIYISPDPRVQARSLSAIGEDLEKVAGALAWVEPKVIAFACTSGSFFKGIDYNREIIRRIEAAAGARAITTSMAAVEALREMGLRKICFITPYEEYRTEKGKEFLEASGFEVPVVKHLTMSTRERRQLSPEAALKVVYELAISAYDAGCDGIFCSCTGFGGAIDIIERVETETGKPMISANQATMWLMLKIACVKKPITGFGELMTRL